MKRPPTFLISVMCFGFAFFYIPILSMMVYSFNASRLATVWGGFSTKWYVSLFRNEAVTDALILSLKIALVSACFATILGTMAGITLARYTKFRGRTLFSGLVIAPLVMPEVITGISLLMFFILMADWVGWPGQRGFTTITLAHITFSMVFVTTIVQARMSQSDRAIEEAAMDLGSRPWQVMFDITLPVISPAILSGWLLASTQSQYSGASGIRQPRTTGSSRSCMTPQLKSPSSTPARSASSLAGPTRPRCSPRLSE